MTLVLILVAIVAGVAVALQSQVMGAMDRIAGTATSVLVTYGLGGLLALGFWLTRKPPAEAVRHIPWYSWSAGALGLVIVGGLGYAAPRLGLSRTLVISIAAQLVAAMLIEHFGLFEVLPRRFALERARSDCCCSSAASGSCSGDDVRARTVFKRLRQPCGCRT